VRPRAANTGRRIGSASAGPEARISSLAASAGPFVPETGASTNSTSGRILCTCIARLSVATTPIVPICAQTAPWASASRTPPSSMTELTMSAVGSIVMTTFASRTESGAEVTVCTPASARREAADVDLSHAIVRNPDLTRFRAIAPPMMPVPITATDMSWPVSLVVMECLSPLAAPRHVATEETRRPAQPKSGSWRVPAGRFIPPDRCLRLRPPQNR
jgi:hypothetical protein